MDRGGDVVGMALDGGSHLQQVVGGERIVQEGIGRHESAGDCGRAAAHATTEGDGVSAAHAQGRHFRVGLTVQKFHGPVGQVFGVRGKFALSFADNFDRRGLAGRQGADREVVPQVEGHAQAVVPRAQVGGGRRGAHFNGWHSNLRSGQYHLADVAAQVAVFAELEAAEIAAVADDGHAGFVGGTVGTQARR